MKIKTSELTGPALDWAVAKLEGGTVKPSSCSRCHYYEERQGLDDAIQYCHHPKMDFMDGSSADSWSSDYKTHKACPISDLTPATYSTDWAQGGPLIESAGIAISFGPQWTAVHNQRLGRCYYGPTPLTAAMRCFVASKLGDEIEIPEELL